MAKVNDATMVRVWRCPCNGTRHYAVLSAGGDTAVVVCPTTGGLCLLSGGVDGLRRWGEFFGVWLPVEVSVKEILDDIRQARTGNAILSQLSQMGVSLYDSN